MYTLTIGTHQHTSKLRNVEDSKTFESYQECIDEMNSAKKFYATIGYVIWFASVTHPDGRREMVEQNLSY